MVVYLGNILGEAIVFCPSLLLNTSIVKDDVVITRRNHGFFHKFKFLMSIIKNHVRELILTLQYFKPTTLVTKHDKVGLMCT